MKTYIFYKYERLNKINKVLKIIEPNLLNWSNKYTLLNGRITFSKYTYALLLVYDIK